MESSDYIPAALAEMVRERERIVIRAARADDLGALRRLSHLADKPVPRGALLVAESDGQILAAVGTDSHAIVSDPFRATADLVELLEVRAGQLHAAAA